MAVCTFKLIFTNCNKNYVHNHLTNAPPPFICTAAPIWSVTTTLFCTLYGEIGLKGYAEISCKITFSKKNERKSKIAKRHAIRNPLK